MEDKDFIWIEEDDAEEIESLLNDARIDFTWDPAGRLECDQKDTDKILDILDENGIGYES